MLISARYVKNDFDVYGRDSSILLSRRGQERDPIFAVYAVSLVNEREREK
jgi:hypothetical protein